ncbi:hypothetical protein PUN28_012888 [Cardiocondyla obscurior]|uniref:Ribosomal protein S19 n=1 Tax=Cardiocondyla obscurior TaxID=286306 RepID=A0AAW2FAT7_9HYME
MGKSVETFFVNKILFYLSSPAPKTKKKIKICAGRKMGESVETFLLIKFLETFLLIKFCSISPPARTRAKTKKKKKSAQVERWGNQWGESVETFFVNKILFYLSPARTRAKKKKKNLRR